MNFRLLAWRQLVFCVLIVACWTTFIYVAQPALAEQPHALVHTLRFAPAAPTTEVSGNITSNTTWDKAHSP